MNDRLPLGFLAAAWLSFASGCSPDIGASCTTSLNCSQMGDRVCDTTMPGGYCTVFSCEADSCPSEAACVAYRQWTSAVPACQSPNDDRMIRTFCMLRCSKNSDCRSGYVCADVNIIGNPWGASLADTTNRDGRICIVPGAVPQNPNQPVGYCQWIDQDSGLPEAYVHPVDASTESDDASGDAASGDAASANGP
jgi:hypothetical protein